LKTKLRRIFRPQLQEVTERHKEELHKVYSLPYISRVIKLRNIRLVGHVACMGEMRNVYTILVGKSDGTNPLERPRSRWEGK